MSDDELKELFRRAAEVVKGVPKELREAAFNRAVDALLGPVKARPAPPRSRSPRSKKAKSEDGPRDVVVVLEEALDRTKHPEISSAPHVLERSLFLLQAARDDHDIDGLGATQIAKVLTGKFRLRTSRQAVSQALDAAGDKVDRTRGPRGMSYRVMQPGDEYLAAGEFGRANSPRKRVKKAPKAKKIERTSRKKRAESKSGSANSKARKKAGRVGRPGAGAMLSELAASGFFAKSRSIADIQLHCEKTLAHKYGLNELSTPLRRAVHSGLLKRDQNKNGQYEYVAK